MDPVIENIYYYLLSLTLVFLLVLIGNAAHYIVHKKISGIVFKPLLWGGIIFASSYSLYQTNLNSVLVIALLLCLANIILENRQVNLPSISLLNQLKVVFVFHFVFYSLMAIFNFSLLFTPNLIPSYDLITFSNVIKMLNNGGGENISLDWINNDKSAVPYHYWEFWLTAPFTKISDLPIHRLFTVIQLPYFGLLVLLGTYELIKKLFSNNILQVNIILSLSILVIISTPINYLVHDVFNLTQYFGMSILTEDKYNIILGLLIIAFYYALETQYIQSFIILSILSVVYPTAAPAIITTSTITAFFIDRKQAIRWILPAILTTIGIMSFYLFQEKNIYYLSFSLEKVKLFNFFTARNIIVGNTLKCVLLLTFPLALFILIEKTRAQLGKIIIFGLLVIFISSCFWGLTHTLWLDSIQLAQTAIKPFFIIINFYCLLLLLKLYKIKFTLVSFFLLTVAGILSYYHHFSSIKHNNIASIDEFNNIQNIISRKKYYGLFSRDTRLNHNIYYKNANFYSPAHELGINNNLMPLICINTNTYTPNKGLLYAFEADLIYNNAFQFYIKSKNNTGVLNIFDELKIDLFIIENNFEDPTIDYKFIKTKFKNQMNYGTHTILYN